jgi:hypothetical protein
MDIPQLTTFTKNAFGPILFIENKYDHQFLEEKESALLPIPLDDSLPMKALSVNKLSLEKQNSRSVSDKKNYLNVSSEYLFDKKKSKKSSVGSYGSNIILITNKEEDSKEGLIIEEINKILKDPKNLRIKKHKKKRNLNTNYNNTNKK